MPAEKKPAQRARKRKRKPAKFDPLAILKAIARNPKSGVTARLGALKILMQRNEAEAAPKGAQADADDLVSAMALKILARKGN